MHAISIIYVSVSDAVLSELPSWVSDSQYQRVEWLNGLLGMHFVLNSVLVRAVW